MAFKTLSQDEGDGEGAIFAEINITPLTDIFLVLLIIFMVTSSVMAQLGVNVDLPKASHAITQAQADGVIVTLLPEGRVRVNDRGVSVEDGTFERALKDALSHTPAHLVVLEGDRRSYLGSAVDIMDRARKAGAERFAIATDLQER